MKQIQYKTNTYDVTNAVLVGFSSAANETAPYSRDSSGRSPYGKDPFVYVISNTNTILCAFETVTSSYGSALQTKIQNFLSGTDTILVVTVGDCGGI